ncbi:MAG: sulfatase-like hydrolase/transferase, partial [Luminiphilus sp.]
MTLACARQQTRGAFQRSGWLLFLLLVAVGCSPDQSAPREHDVGKATSPAPRPNILLIVVDDMGYSDIGAFGGEIPTPHLDALAREGTRFSDFQVLPACSPTRAALLTGQEPHAVGFGSLAEELADNQKGTPAYAGALPAGVPTMASLLGQAGYRTYLSGKWHLGGVDDPGPNALGFDQSFALVPGGASHFPDMAPAYSPDPDAVAPYTVNDELITTLPGNYRYSSQFFADELIRMIGPEPDAPFFAYLSFTAPHWPLHAPDAAIAQFAGDYQAGYEQLRVQRLNRLKAEGLVPDNAVQSALPPKVRPWAELSEEERRRESRAMAVYAAMISEIDRHTGRVIDHLAQTGTLDNTLVIFFSDNGAEGHDLDETWSAELFPAIRAVIDQRFDHSTEQMGRPGSYPLYGAGWAHAAAPHLRMYKAFTSEGGTRVTAFMRLPGGQSQPT